jgi:shikimate kinase
MSSIILVGFMGTGKTVVGKKLAEKLGLKFVDLDMLIEEKLGMSIREIFERFGEPYFRRIEREVVSEMSKHHVRDDGLVIATGGGVVLDSRNVADLKSMGTMIHLCARPDVIVMRTADTHHRPLLETEEREMEVHHLLMVRRPYYARADYEIDTSDLSVENVVEKIMHHLQEPYNGPRVG